MRDLVAGVHWALAGSRGEYSAGNGAAMRIAPLAFVLDPTAPADRKVIRDVCRVTHHNDEAYVGALSIVIAIRLILTGTWSKDKSLLGAVAESIPDSAVRDRIEEIVPLKIHPWDVASRFGATGHVVDTVPLALYSAQFNNEPHPKSEERKRSAITLIKYVLAAKQAEVLATNRQELLTILLWKLTLAPCRNKYATRYQSKGAMDGGSKLRHDHVYQRKKMIAALEKPRRTK